MNAAYTSTAPDEIHLTAIVHLYLMMASCWEYKSVCQRFSGQLYDKYKSNNTKEQLFTQQQKKDTHVL